MKNTCKADSFDGLVSWIQTNGGFIHPDLELFSNDDDNYRGVRVKQQQQQDSSDGIPKGVVLAQIPSQCVLYRYCIPGNENDDSIQVCNASNWLKCLGALLRALKDVKDNGNTPVNNDEKDQKQNMSFFQPYLESLPDNFDTILSWSDDELSSLSGTSLFETVKGSSDIDNGENVGLNAGMIDSLKQRYSSTSIQSYLTNVLQSCEESVSREQNTDVITTFESFLWAVNCITTRGFHHIPTNHMHHLNGTSGSDSKKRRCEASMHDDAEGPYLIPFVDLLNHCSLGDERKSTTLRKNPDNAMYFLETERHILPGEEVLHSYGRLNSQQLLRTYGFVDLQRSESLLRNYQLKSLNEDNISWDRWDLSPALLHRESVVSSCYGIAFSADTQKRALDLEKCKSQVETWDPCECWDEKSHFIKKFIPEVINIPYDSQFINSDILTLCCILLLPKEAFDDFIENPALLDESILEDPFLCYLVSKSISKSLEVKLTKYPGGLEFEDFQFLSNHMKTSCFDRNLFGRIVAFEEKLCLSSIISKIHEKT